MSELFDDSAQIHRRKVIK